MGKYVKFGASNFGLTTTKDILSTFKPITLEEMDAVKLMNRTDTKFVFHRDRIPEIFHRIQDHYRVLEVNGDRLNAYRSLYYDTPEFQFYHLHQNGRKKRHKVRFRKYVGSDLTFLEIKFKNNKNRTVKSRIKVPDFETDLQANSMQYIEEVMGYKTALVPKLWNSFERVTLVSKHNLERLTIDFGLAFDFDGKKSNMDQIIIAEVKQEKLSRNSTFIVALKALGIHPMKISKYCVGALKLYPGLKYNNFKAKLLYLKKINDGISA